jgi:dynein heavy chain
MALKTHDMICIQKAFLNICFTFFPTGQPSFKPTFQECDDVVRGVLDAMVLSVSGLPRVGSTAAGSNFALRSQDANTAGTGRGTAAGMPGAQNPTLIPTTTLFEDTVVKARKVRSMNQMVQQG